MSTTPAAFERLEPRLLLSASIEGAVWHDLNGDGQRGLDEPGLAEWRVFIDEDGDEQWDSGERFEMTGSDGSYALTGLEAGTYVVAQEVPDGWEQTSPGQGAAASAAVVGTMVSVEPMTTSGSVSPAYVIGEAVPDDVLGSPVTQVSKSGPLINIDDFRADTRFSGIDGAGLATVIIDTGIDLDHPFFGPDADSDGVADRIVYSYDFADGDSDATGLDSHGSNVSSIVASSDTTYTGMAPGADIIHLKVFRDSGASYFSYVEAALQWVVANAAAYDIVSVTMSIGDEGNYDVATSRYGLGDELAALAAMDVIVVSASGNDFYGSDSDVGVTYPSADPNSLSIGAVYDSGTSGYSYGSGAQAYSSAPDRIAPFSQRHPTLTTVLAPGAPITGAGATGGTVTYHGTSQAAPHVAGIAVLAQQLALTELGRRLSPDEFASLLRSTGVTINDGDDEEDNVTNTGLDFPRVDVLALGEAIVAMADNAPVHVVHLDAEQIETDINFGARRRMVPSSAAQAPDLVAASDTGSSDTDDLTALNNSTASAVLQFSIGGTVDGATVTLYADGTEIGSAVATGDTTLVESRGDVTLSDGLHTITARQTEPDKSESADSVGLDVTIDTVAPAVEAFGLDSTHGEWIIGRVDWSLWIDGRAYDTAPWSAVDVLAVSFDEAVTAAVGDMTVDGLAGAVALTGVAGGGTADVAWTAGEDLGKDWYAVVLGAGVTDIAGNPLGAWSFDLAVLPGDVNGDGEVGSLDRGTWRDAYGSEIGYAGYTTLVDVNGDGIAGSLDRWWIRQYYGQSLPPEAQAAVEADPAPGGAMLVASTSGSARTFTTAAGATVTSEWSAARGGVDCGSRIADCGLNGVERRAKPQAVYGLASASGVDRSTDVDAATRIEDARIKGGSCAAIGEENGDRHLRFASEPVPVFFSSDVRRSGADRWSIGAGDGATAAAQLEPDLSTGLTDPLTGEAIR